MRFRTSAVSVVSKICCVLAVCLVLVLGNVQPARACCTTAVVSAPDVDTAVAASATAITAAVVVMQELLAYVVQNSSSGVNNATQLTGEMVRVAGQSSAQANIDALTTQVEALHAATVASKWTVPENPTTFTMVAARQAANDMNQLSRSGNAAAILISTNKCSGPNADCTSAQSEFARACASKKLGFLPSSPATDQLTCT